MNSQQEYNVSLLKLSPELIKYQHLMPISPEDKERLKQDIVRSNEIRDPIKVYFNKNDDCLILGGANRWEIAMELGWPTVPIKIYNLTKKDQREKLVIDDNLSRRHLTLNQKKMITETLIKQNPVQSNRQIAQKTKVDHKTVGKIRKKLESVGEIPQMKKITGSDGKNYNSKKKSKSPEKNNNDQAVETERIKIIKVLLKDIMMELNGTNEKTIKKAVVLIDNMKQKLLSA